MVKSPVNRQNYIAIGCYILLQIFNFNIFPLPEFKIRGKGIYFRIAVSDNQVVQFRNLYDNKSISYVRAGGLQTSWFEIDSGTVRNVCWLWVRLLPVSADS